jgi:23S rRNA (cytidine2498-2'-O)-methyltransferase
MTEYLFYCRSGYEPDLLAELDDKLALRGHCGFANFQKDSAVLRYQLVSESSNTIRQRNSMIALSDLVFARQKCLVLLDVSFSDLTDRVFEILSALSTIDLQQIVFGDIRVEHADTESGKEMAKFCKKFTVPLRNALRAKNLLFKQPDKRAPYLHLFFESGEKCLLAISFAKDRSEDLLGVKRLKFPQDAPSRSTLKLEEAIQSFCTRAQQSMLFVKGMSAVDLGACPGGWTYQLVSRGIRTEAIDNGAMDEKLMQTGLVDYHSVDGFSYRPQQGHVDWLVCDMIEKPDRVALLMQTWLQNAWASAAIFNLKLPMKKRYKTLAPLMEQFHQLHQKESPAYITAKHLYHNRDEVTVMIIKNSQMLREFSN